MQTYKEYAPTSFDIKGLHGDSLDRSNWFVAPCGRNRDSKIFQESNFHACLELLGGEQEGLVEVHRFGHWGCGWFEIILVHPDLSNKIEEIEKRLENCSLLNEDDAMTRLWNAACDYWAESSLRDRLYILERYGDKTDSIFCIRRDTLPESICANDLDL